MIQIICEEKNLNYDIVMEAVESALAAAYRKDFGNRQQNIKLKFDPEIGSMQAWDIKEVTEDYSDEELEKAQEKLSSRREKARTERRELAEEEMADLIRFNPKTQIMLSLAKEIKKDAKIGDVLEIVLEIPGDFGRMAAQTAKQVIIQKLREAERNVVFGDFKEQEGRVVQGIVQRRDKSGSIIVDLGKITGILPAGGQIQREQYRPGIRLPFLLASVEMSSRGPEILLSRSDKRMVEVIFSQEIPEVESGEVVIKGIARDPGNRSKVAVFTGEDTIDPIGSCIGQRGSRITTIIESLGGEKIDVIQFSDDSAEFIKNALSPAKISKVALNEKKKEAAAYVADDQFSLAIGRNGQNVRLAAALTGWTINITQEGEEERAASSAGQDGEKEKESANSYISMKVSELKELLKEKGLPVSGKKDELVKRLESGGEEKKDQSGEVEKEESDTKSREPEIEDIGKGDVHK